MKRILCLALLAAVLLAGCNAETQPATSVATTSATLHATLSASSGEKVAWWFRYREVGTSSWTDTTHNGPATLGDVANYDFNVNVTGLTAGRRYEYQVCGYREAANGYDAVGSAQSPVCADSAGFGLTASNDQFTTGFPTPQSAGTPANWSPVTTTSSSVTLSTNGQVYKDVRLTGGADITVSAQNVTIKRVELQGGSIDNDNGPCGNGLLVVDTTIGPPAGGASNDGEGVIGYGGYTARNVEVTNRNEGFRSSSVGDCGPITVEDSYAKIIPPPGCGDWHGDGLQSYFGDAVTVRNVTIDMRTSGCYGTAPFFRPKNQGNQGAATIDRFLVMGQGYSFRLGTTGTVNGLKVVNNSWVFGPVDVDCSLVSQWDARKVTIDSNYQVTADNGAITCTGNGT